MIGLCDDVVVVIAGHELCMNGMRSDANVMVSVWIYVELKEGKLETGVWVN